MSSGKAWPPRMWVYKDDWEKIYERCDLGDGHHLRAYAHPHVNYQIPNMIKLISMEEHSAILQEKDKEIERTKLAADMYCDKLEAEVKMLREALRKCVLWAECVSMKLENRNEINWTYLNDARDALGGGKDES